MVLLYVVVLILVIFVCILAVQAAHDRETVEALELRLAVKFQLRDEKFSELSQQLSYTPYDGRTKNRTQFLNALMDAMGAANTNIPSDKVNDYLVHLNYKVSSAKVTAESTQRKQENLEQALRKANILHDESNNTTGILWRGKVYGDPCP